MPLTPLSPAIAMPLLPTPPPPIVMRLPGQPDVNAFFAWSGVGLPWMFYKANPIVLVGAPPPLPSPPPLFTLNGCHFTASIVTTTVQGRLPPLLLPYFAVLVGSTVTCIDGALLGYVGTVSMDQCAGSGLLMS